MCNVDDNYTLDCDYQQIIAVEKVIKIEDVYVDNFRLTVQIYNKKSRLSRG